MVCFYDSDIECKYPDDEDCCLCEVLNFKIGEFVEEIYVEEV